MVKGHFPGQIDTGGDTALVNKLAREIHRVMAQGPRRMRLPGQHHQGSVGGGRNTFTPLAAWARGAGKNYRALFRRAMKKAGQPFRKNMHRKAIRAKAAGKNEVTRRTR